MGATNDRGSVGIAGFLHETNSFSPYLADITAFSGATGILLRGRAEMSARFETDCPAAGFEAVGRQAGYRVVPVVEALAMPSGTIVQDAFESLSNELVAGLLAIENPVAFLLSLHGAAVAEGCDDPEGEIVSRLRAARPSVPIGVVLDHHAGVSEQLVASCDVVVGYKTEPHVDLKDCGESAARVVLDLAMGRPGPIDSCFVRLPMLLPIENLLTTQGPLATLMERALSLAENETVVDISLFPGFAYSDKPAAGASVLVQTWGEPRLANDLAIDLAAEFWERRTEFLKPAEDPEAGVERALRSTRSPVVLVDKADHPGAGGVGDGTLLLRLLDEHEATSTVVAPIHDPESVAHACELGVGASGHFTIGGRYTGSSFETDARIRLISDGRYDAMGPVDHGASLSIGRSAVLEVGGIEVVVCEGRSGVSDPELLRRLGIEPTRRRILCIKALGTFRAAFDPIVGEIIMIDGEGAAPQSLSKLEYRHVKRPIDPLDADVQFDPAAMATLICGRA